MSDACTSQSSDYVTALRYRLAGIRGSELLYFSVSLFTEMFMHSGV